jgi:hypothetical protein
LSHITFTREEVDILNFGFQHSTEKLTTPCLTNIAIETKKAIKLLYANMQGAYRVLATKQLKQIINSHNSCNHLHKRQLYITRQLKNKLISNNVILVPADKGRTIIAVDNTMYVNKVNDFLTEKQFPALIKDPTEKYQKHIQKVLQQSDKIINKRKVKYLLQNKPKTPVLNAQLKLHKANIPICPVVNNINAPTYKGAKFLTHTLKEYLELDNQYVV